MRLAALALLFAGCPCRGNPGVLVNARLEAARPDSSFVTERANLIVSAPDGIRRAALDGSSSAKIFDRFSHRDVPSVSVQDVSADGKTYVLSDSDTNLYVGDAKTGNTFEIPALRKRLSAAAISPDGTKIAATRHSDFDLPQGSQTNDDTVFVIDLATKQVDVIPASTTNWPTKLEWSADGKALWLTFAWEKGHQWLTLADRKRVGHPHRYPAAPPAPLRDDPRKPPVCPQKVVHGKDPELRVVEDPNKPARVVVQLLERTRGFHDYLADFGHETMSPACKHIVFEHRRRIWVATLDGGAVGPVAEGAWLFFVP